MRVGEEPPLTTESSQKVERLELAQKFLSIMIAIASFWIITLFWNYYNFGNLELVPRLGLAAALSWDVFLHAEAIGMLIMTMMKEKWQAEAQDARKEAQASEARAQVWEALADERAQTWEARAQAREAQAEAREAQAQLQTREAQLATREAQLEAREAQAREAQAQEIIRGLRRQLAEAQGGEDANGANA